MKFLGAFLFASLFLTSCGGGSESIKLKIDKASITGDSKEYIEVVPGEYELKKVKDELDGEQLQISLKFKVIKEYDQSKLDENTAIGDLSLRIIDESGTPFDLEFNPADMSDYDKLTSLLKGKKGDEVTILFKPMGFAPEESLLEEILKNAKGIEITRADITNPKTEPIIDNSVSSDSETGESSDSGNCDQFCSDYEAFADEYVAFMKKYKANPADMTILSEYSEMMSKAADMQESSKDCSADPSVAARITKALAKIAKSAM